MTWPSDCYKKPPPNHLEIDGEAIGISGMAEIMERALSDLDASEEEIDAVLLSELKAHNYVPASEEGAYLKALKKEFRQLSARRREEMEEVYQGIPREEIPWYPRVDKARCEGCTSCVEFCSQNVFEFFDGKSQVVRPYNCIVGKASCRAFCPDKAISFPARMELKETIAALRAKHNPTG
jgi:NAD-dependent dihydropyrimidine dehydrogenase PreA subunit